MLGKQVTAMHETEEKDKFCARELSAIHEIEEQGKSCAQEFSVMEGRETLDEWQPEL